MEDAPYCQYFLLSPLRTAIEPLIIPALVLAYLPQYVRFTKHGTAGFTSAWVLWFCIASNMQLVNLVANLAGQEGFRCAVYQHGIDNGAQLFGILLAYFEVMAQWMTAMILLHLFIKHRVDWHTQAAGNDSDDTRPLLGLRSASSGPVIMERSSRQLGLTITAHAASCFAIAIITLLPASEDLGVGYLQMYGILVCHWIASVLSLLCVLRLAYVQIRDAVHFATNSKGVSLVSLALQALVLVILAVLQATRPRLAGETITPSPAFLWYVAHLNVGVNYGIMGVTNGISLGIRLYYLRPHER